MITKERADELMARYAAEHTSNPSSQIWRLELNEEEKALVAAWDSVIVRILLDALKKQTQEPSGPAL